MRNGYPKTMKDYAITTLSSNPEKTYKEVASELGVNTETIRQWWLKEHNGNSRAKNHPGRRSNYSEEFRKNAVSEMVKGMYSAIKEEKDYVLYTAFLIQIYFGQKDIPCLFWRERTQSIAENKTKHQQIYKKVHKLLFYK